MTKGSRKKGQKVFISAGDHDQCENIIHLMLARIEGAPKGTKGISLFVVPKYRLDGADNDVTSTTRATTYRTKAESNFW